MAARCSTCERWLDPGHGLCRYCGAWTANETGNIGAVSKNKTTTLDQVKPEPVARATVGEPWDTCFGGGGIVWTSTTLVGGPPGSGKTTGLIQILSSLATLTGRRSYLLSAEQGPGDLRLTADRLLLPNLDRFRVLSEFGVGAEIDEELLKEDPPAGMVVDSISALCGKDVHAAIAIAKTYKKYSVKYKAPAFLICHMTKENDYAGLMALQHEVDALVTIFPEDDGIRHLKPWKNRNGSTHSEYELVMTELGLFAPPPKPEKKAKGQGRGKVMVAVAAKLEPLLEPEIDTDPQPIPLPVPKGRPKLPAILELDGQPLVLRKSRKSGGEASSNRAQAIEGEALKRRRPPMPKLDPGPLKAKLGEIARDKTAKSVTPKKTAKKVAKTTKGRGREAAPRA